MSISVLILICIVVYAFAGYLANEIEKSTMSKTRKNIARSVVATVLILGLLSLAFIHN